MKEHPRFILVGLLLCCATAVFGQAEPTTPAAGLEAPPNMVLLYYGYDSNGPRDWKPERIKYYVGYYRDRGTDAEAPVDTFFDTVLWMYRLSSRGNLFEAGAKHKPTTKPDWEECLARLFEPGKQLNALETAAAELEKRLVRRVSVNVILTLPYPDVRVAAWSEAPDDPQWDFRSSDEPRLAAVRWYVDAALERWNQAKLPHLRLLGFYWFNESHINLRDPQKLADESLKSDLSLMRAVARHVHALRVAGRPLTLTWIPYSPYGGERVGVVTELLESEPAERIDYLMIQPNYFFARWKKQRADLTAVVRAAAAAGAGVEIEFDSNLLRDEACRQRLRDYLEVIPAEHPQWNAAPAGYYQGLRAVHELATKPELAPLYDELYKFVKNRRVPHAVPKKSVGD
jgi:hypothetical protein